MSNMTIQRWKLRPVIEDICDNYCKYPEAYLSQFKDPDEANEAMLREVCENCPLNNIGEL